MVGDGVMVVLVGVGVGIVIFEFKSNGRSGNNELNPLGADNGDSPDGRSAR